MEMFDKLEDIVNRYEDITAELSNPDVVNDQDRFRKLMKEQNNILPIVTAFTEYKDCKKNIEDSLAMLSEESDEELLELAKEELNESKKRVEELENELKILLLPKDPFTIIFCPTFSKMSVFKFAISVLQIILPPTPSRWLDYSIFRQNCQNLFISVNLL